MTLYGIEPWADERSDLAAGIAVMHTVACHGGEAKAPHEYMPLLKRGPVKRQSEEDLQKTWDGICDTMERAERDKKG